MKPLSESENFIARLRNHYSELRWYAFRVLKIKLSKNPLFAVRLENALVVLENAALSNDDQMIQQLQNFNFRIKAMFQNENEPDDQYLTRVRQGDYLKKLTAIQHFLFDIADWLRTQPPLQNNDRYDF